MPELSRRVLSFTDSVIRRMTRINDMTPGSINLSQGFPDFDPPWPTSMKESLGSGRIPRRRLSSPAAARRP